MQSVTRLDYFIGVQIKNRDFFYQGGVVKATFGKILNR